MGDFQKIFTVILTFAQVSAGSLLLFALLPKSMEANKVHPLGELSLDSPAHVQEEHGRIALPPEIGIAAQLPTLSEEDADQNRYVGAEGKVRKSLQVCD